MPSDKSHREELDPGCRPGLWDSLCKLSLRGTRRARRVAGLSAGYGSAGEQPERRISPTGGPSSEPRRGLPPRGSHRRCFHPPIGFMRQTPGVWGQRPHDGGIVGADRFQFCSGPIALVSQPLSENAGSRRGLIDLSNRPRVTFAYRTMIRSLLSLRSKATSTPTKDSPT